MSASMLSGVEYREKLLGVQREDEFELLNCIEQAAKKATALELFRGVQVLTRRAS